MPQSDGLTEMMAWCRTSATTGHAAVTRRVGPGTRGSMVVGVLGLVLLTSSCGTASPGDDAASPSSGAAAKVTPKKDVTEKPAAATKKPADSVVGKYVPVKRNGKAAAPSISAPHAPFTKAVRYVDGTTLQVTSIKQGKVAGKGPGVFPGQPTTTFALRLTNGAKKQLSLNQVVVTATYGSPKRVASPVYDASAHDFTGRAVPGASAKATYTFSIPTADLGSVVMFVDFDSVHVSGTFTGSAR